jgi:hypothetical protein
VQHEQKLRLICGAAILSAMLTACDEETDSTDRDAAEAVSVPARPVDASVYPVTTDLPDADVTSRGVPNVADASLAQDAALAAGPANNPGLPNSISSRDEAGACDTSCAQPAKAGCEYFTAAGCISACKHQQIQARGHCDALVSDYHACHGKASFHCVQGGPQTDECRVQYAAMDNCLAVNPFTCAPREGASTCDACIATMCCAERETCDADCQAYRACVDTCHNQSCQEACAKQSSTGEVTDYLYQGCQQDHCASVCKR